MTLGVVPARDFRNHPDLRLHGDPGIIVAVGAGTIAGIHRRIDDWGVVDVDSFAWRVARPARDAATSDVLQVAVLRRRILAYPNVHVPGAIPDDVVKPIAVDVHHAGE